MPTPPDVAGDHSPFQTPEKAAMWAGISGPGDVTLTTGGIGVWSSSFAQPKSITTNAAIAMDTPRLMPPPRESPSRRALAAPNPRALLGALTLALGPGPLDQLALFGRDGAGRQHEDREEQRSRGHHAASPSIGTRWPITPSACGTRRNTWRCPHHETYSTSVKSCQPIMRRCSMRGWRMRAGRPHSGHARGG